MTTPIRKVVILGGGTAGWMAASYLGKALQGTAEITVLEAPSIPRIGVGEATIPNLQTAFFDYLGIEESEWMRECNASFKIGIKFINWRTPGRGQATPRDAAGQPDYFYHLFGLMENIDGIPLSHYWVERKLAGQAELPFDASCYAETAMMDANLAPRDVNGTKYANYAWHFDARLVADFLRRFATEKQGVVHIEDEMVQVQQDQYGFITALTTKSGGVITGDLFIDCSGFRGLLINKALAEPFIDMSDHLLCDSAVATAVPARRRRERGRALHLVDRDVGRVDLEDPDAVPVRHRLRLLQPSSSPGTRRPRSSAACGAWTPSGSRSTTSGSGSAATGGPG